MAEAPQTSEQKFTNKLLEILESSKNSVIWTRVKYEEILEKIKSRKTENCQDYYYMQREVSVFL
jgi:ribosome-binding ATPase YchF (GTP1/OBG family)